jgi:hypothetical protein
MSVRRIGRSSTMSVCCARPVRLEQQPSHATRHKDRGQRQGRRTCTLCGYNVRSLSLRLSSIWVDLTFLVPLHMLARSCAR